MRSRPQAKLLLHRTTVAPGEDLRAESVLTAKSETPVDFVAMRLRGELRIGVGVGRSRAVHDVTFFAREWRSEPMTISKGELRLPALFPIPPNLPPSYSSGDASIVYTMLVHVSIPWWPDRRENFQVPIVFGEVPPPARTPTTFATSRVGPQGTTPFLEISLDTTTLALGEVLSGSISVQNLHGRRVRGIDLSFVEVESVLVPRQDVRESRRFRLRVLDGAPAEGAAIPFRVRLPESATATFACDMIPGHPLRVTTHLEVRVIVAWGEDAVLTAPIVVTPRSTNPNDARGWVAPVGRERQVLVWRSIAEKIGLVTDEEAQRMTSQRGGVTIAITAEHRDKDYYLVARLGWQDLGLDLEVGERRWTDALATSLVKSDNDEVDERLRVHLREPAQARAIVDALDDALVFDDVAIDDRGALLSSRRAPHVADVLELFVLEALTFAEKVDAAISLLAPPILFAADVPSWEALATRLRGRLERGRMWIHDAQVGTDSVAIGSVWERSGLLLGSTIHVAIDPPLDGEAFTTLDDPRLSPAARDAWRELHAKAKSVTVDARELAIELDGRLADPQTIMPLVELAVTLRRALGGSLAAGPFR